MLASIITARLSFLRFGLSRREQRIARAVAETLFWDGEHPVPPERLDVLLDELDDYVRCAGGLTRGVLAVALAVVQLGPPLVLRRPRRLTSLSLERRLACLQRLESSRVALLPLLLGVIKIMLSMIYFEQAEALAETGYDGGCMTLAAGTEPPVPTREATA
jgi:hypothetical protein